MLTREQATLLMRRIMDRAERDGALHLDSGVEELMMGWAGIEAMATPKPAEAEAEKAVSATDLAPKQPQTKSNAELLKMIKSMIEQRAEARKTTRIKPQYGLLGASGCVTRDTVDALAQSDAIMQGQINKFAGFSIRGIDGALVGQKANMLIVDDPAWADTWDECKSDGS